MGFLRTFLPNSAHVCPVVWKMWNSDTQSKIRGLPITYSLHINNALNAVIDRFSPIVVHPAVVRGTASGVINQGTPSLSYGLGLRTVDLVSAIGEVVRSLLIIDSASYVRPSLCVVQL